jgi:hypothetical protein
MFGSLILMGLRYAVLGLISQGVQAVIKKFLARALVVVQAILAKYPTAGPAVVVVVANVLARYGFHVSVTALMVVASAVAVAVAALVRGSVKAVAKRAAAESTSK